MLFTYILTGWEGSATDARVWADALGKGFSVPEGFYYLADAGYPHCKELLVPFRGIRYHLQEWGAAGVRYVSCLIYFIVFLKKINRPVNAKELFNLRHAQARNVIERIFGVLKQRFRILLLPPRYPLDFQARIPAALCALQNFIQEIDGDEGAIPTDPQAAYTYFPSDVDNDHDIGFISEDDNEGNSEVKLRRVNIANEMWERYLEYTADSETDSD
jgi:hypothetical protein